jgi:hypothetical protein
MPSWLVMVPLVVVVWFIAMLTSGWPGAVAHATTAQRTTDAGHAGVQKEDDNNNSNQNSNINNNTNNNSNSNTNDNESENSNDNEHHEDVNVVPVPVPVSAPPPAPAGPSVSQVDEVSQCLSNGGRLVYQGPDAGIAVTSYQDNLNVTLTRVSPTSQPAPPGVLIGNYVFRLSASPCGGAAYTVLPSEVNLAVSYSDGLAAGRDESRFALVRYDGSIWSTAPKLYRDADHNHVSASVAGLGVYALVQQ